MADDQNQDIVSKQESPQSSEAPTIEPPIQLTDSSPTDMAPVAPEAPRDAFTPVPVEDQNGANKAENRVPEFPAPAPLTSATSQTQSLAREIRKLFYRRKLI